MFTRLLHRVSEAPSRLPEFITFSKKLAKDSGQRKIGLVFIVCTLAILLFNAILPFEKSTYFSNNYLINGVKSREVLLNAWDQKNSNIKDIYTKYGVQRQDILNLSAEPNDVISDSPQNNYWMVSRSPSSFSTEAGSSYSQAIAIKTENSKVFYFAPLHSSKYPSKQSYKAFRGRSSITGKPFWILAESGNYVQFGKTIQNNRPAKPSIEVRKSLIKNPDKNDDSLNLVIAFRNSAPDSLAENITIKDIINTDYFSIQDISSSNFSLNGAGEFIYAANNLTYSDFNHVLSLTIVPKNSSYPKEALCTTSQLSGSNFSAVAFGLMSPYCSTSQALQETQNKESTRLGFDITIQNVSQDTTKTKVLEQPVSASDILEYELVTINDATTPVSNYTISHDVSDLLDYANLDLDFLVQQGGSFDEQTNTVLWQNQNLPPNSKTSHWLRVQLKNPLPSTNQSENISTNFNCYLDSFYGEYMSIKVKCPAVKALENLPNISNWTSIGLFTIFSIISAYFLIRSRLILKETQIIRNSYQHKNPRGEK